MRRLTRARRVSLETALAEVPAELQRILTTIGELDQRNARLRDAVQAKVDDCVSAMVTAFSRAHTRRETRSDARTERNPNARAVEV